MKKITLIIFISVISLIGATLTAETINDGWWMQTASTAGEAENVAMRILVETPHIISLDSNNGWVGYARYNEEKDLYTGFFELLKPESLALKDDWSGELFDFTLAFDGLTLTMNAQSPEHTFQATYWKK